MKKFILFIIVLFLVSCASTNNVRKPSHTHAYDTYKHRKQIVRENQKIMEHGFVFGSCKKK